MTGQTHQFVACYFFSLPFLSGASFMHKTEFRIYDDHKFIGPGILAVNQSLISCAGLCLGDTSCSLASFNSREKSCLFPQGDFKSLLDSGYLRKDEDCLIIYQLIPMKPVFIGYKQSGKSLFGEDVNITFVALGYPDPVYQLHPAIFSQPGSMLSAVQTKHLPGNMMFDENTGLLQIKSYTQSNDGSYNVFATNSEGQERYVFDLPLPP